ncbi:hypothetical protein A6R68_10436 [Neotoma lepida]|uniref:Uncharacterized protein n=1 Tax=Neotoma lepida TaxID=56216 RepID=A0A1A6FXW5_NEOLE|nr:hypothetical protein A6R68_10436 [Neotoma lepida]
MPAYPTATSPAMDTCLAPKVGSLTPDTGPKVSGPMGMCGQLPCALNPTPIPPKPLVTGLSPSGVNIGNVGCYIYDPVEIRSK